MTGIDRTASRLAGLTGWRRHAVGFALGVGATLALPPVNFFPVLVVALTLLVWLMSGDGSNRRAAFAAGWWFGFGYFTIGLYWIGNALLTFADQHAWMLPFATLGLPAFLAIFTGVAAAAADFAGRGFLTRALALAIALAATDWLRGHVLTGFPWNLFGHAWAGIDPLLQSAAAYGVYGQSLMVLLIAALPAGIAGGSLRRRAAAAGASILLLAGHWIGGEMRLAAAPTDVVDGVGLRLVQSNVPQREKWASDLRARNLRLLYDLSVEDRPAWVTHIVWAETAATALLEDDPAGRQFLAAAIPPGGALITGAPRRLREPYRVFNSVLALDDRGDVIGSYDKAHLVPFGEYVPLASALPLEIITQGSVGYTPGPGARTIRLPGLPPFAPAICYEIIFPGAVVDRTDRPAFILNVTNDAWYGVSAGPHQHFAIARVRAVEEGLPLVRSAYTGISGVTDAYGRVRETIGLNNRGYLDVRLPVAAERTLYSRLGDAGFAILLLVSGIVMLAARRRGRDSRSGSSA